MGWVVNATPRPLYPRERPGTHCTGGWVSPRLGGTEETHFLLYFLEIVVVIVEVVVEWFI
jgi:hypothetical protein